MKVDLNEVACRSAFDISSGTPRALQFNNAAGGADARLRMVELEDVLYLPSALDRGQSVCIADQAFVPKESVLDCWTVEFLRQSRATNPEWRDRYSDDFEVDSFRKPVCILGNLFSRNFGHWTEELLKVAVLERSQTDCCYVISNLPSYARESLDFLGIDERRIMSVERPTVFERAIFTTAIGHETIGAYPSVLSCLRDLVQSRLRGGESGYGKRLWLERMEMLTNGGMVVNAEEVHRCLKQYDFDIVDMATLSIAEQFKAASCATTIAGPHGSQFVHAQFMPTSSTVIECFSPVHVNPSILQICQTLKHSYHQIVARSHIIEPYPHGRDCHVDCEHLRLVLDSLRKT